MIKTAAQILAELADLSPSHVQREVWVRRKAGPPQPCLNTHRGCTGRTGEPRSGRGWCARCYNRWSKHGDSWAHSPNMKACTKRNCFLGHNRSQT